MRSRQLLVLAIEGAACLLLAAIGLALYNTRGEALPTLAPTPTAAASATLPPLGVFVTLAPLPTHAAAPSPTPPPRSYVVTEGDTLWAIALRFGFELEALIAANPSLNPDRLSPGDVVTLPEPPTPKPLAAPAPTVPPANAQVSPWAGGLRLRQGPGRSQPILTLLEAETPLSIVGRTGDSLWVQVITAGGEAGWVLAEYVDVFVDLDSAPVTGQTAAAPTGEASGLNPLPTPAGEYVPSPYVSNLTPRVREVFLFGYAYGNRPDVFSKVGDSITVNEAFLAPIGYGQFNLREYEYLRPVVNFYSYTPARDANSFANTSLAAQVGWPAQAVLTPKAADEDLCLEGEAPLVCEYRLVRPSVALIMLGTNDLPNTPIERYERNMRDVIEISIELGVVPILSTLPPMLRAGMEGRAEQFNDVLRRLANEYQMPLVDYWAALRPLPDLGLSGDGIHPSVAPGPADFTPANLEYGLTVRTLTALQALDAVWRWVTIPE